MAWNRTYRPTNFEQVHLQGVREQLQKVFSSGVIPQVFLFAGPRGAGKTTSARIVGAMLNSPANADVVKAWMQGSLASGEKNKAKQTLNWIHPDPSDPETRKILNGSSFLVQELDAASNRGIDDVRSLKERLSIPPSQGLISVYILDEVHMFTTEAFNALLKMLEEPPKHVVFVLATTEMHSLPETIVSRATVIPFYKASDEELTSALTSVLEQEKVAFDLEAVQIVASSVDGSFRDALKQAEYIVSQAGNLKVETISQLLQSSSQDQLKTFLAGLVSKKSEPVIAFFKQCRDAQLDTAKVFKQLIHFLHQDVLASYTGKPSLYDPKISAYILKLCLDNAPQADEVIPLIRLELACLEVISKAGQRNEPSAHSPKKPPAPRKVVTETVASTQAEAHEFESVDVPPETEESEPPSVSPTLKKEIISQAVSLEVLEYIVETWQEYIAAVSARNLTVASLLRTAVPTVDSGKLVVGVWYSFHQQQLKQPVFAALLGDVFLQKYQCMPTLEIMVLEQNKPDQAGSVTIVEENPELVSDLVADAESYLT